MYRYVENNPIGYFDPLGLQVNYGDDFWSTIAEYATRTKNDENGELRYGRDDSGKPISATDYANEPSEYDYAKWEKDLRRKKLGPFDPANDKEPIDIDEILKKKPQYCPLEGSVI